MIVDSQGNEVKTPPKWHNDVNPRTLLTWCGHWFTFEGIDPEHDENVIFFRYKGPTKATKRRDNASKN